MKIHFEVVKIFIAMGLGVAIGLWLSSLLPDAPLLWVMEEKSAIAAKLGGVGLIFCFAGAAGGMGYIARLLFQMFCLKQKLFDVMSVLYLISYQLFIVIGFILVSWYGLSLLKILSSIH